MVQRCVWNRRSILTLLLAALLTLSAVGCGNTTENSDTTVDTASTTAPVETEPEATFDSVAQSYHDRDYDGYVLRVGVRDMVDWQTMDVIA